MSSARSFARLALALAAPLALAVTALTGCDARPIADATPPCLRCHGSDGLSAPPRSVRGLVETTDRPVGAHRRHLGDGPIRAAVACEECHVVPARIEGHFADGAATITWSGALARAQGANPAWDPASETCSGVYCHGATLAGGTAKAPVWTRVDGTQRTCESCHGFPPPSHASFRDALLCHRCHSQTVRPDYTIDVAGGQHVDGTLDLSLEGACNFCHDAPPDTFAHRAHVNPALPSTVAYGSLATLEDVSPSGGTRYEFGCGQCHPLDPADHFSDAGGDGLPDVVLSPAGAFDRLKARNDPAAAWDPVARTCSGVTCHSSGQEAPAFVVSPPWDGPPGSLGCGGCHGNPPQYPSGGAGAVDANSHVDLDLEQLSGAAWEPAWEFGHFVGLPGANHSSKHGGAPPWDPVPAAAPITCQACHFETVDPANVRAGGGFFYFDASGDYDLRPAGLAGREAYSSWQSSQCATCHAADPGAGRVLPLRHVNGRRDVAFDRRTSLPPGYGPGLPALATADPVRPYYMTTSPPTSLDLAPADCATNPVPSCDLASDVVMRDVAGGGAPVLTLTLEHAAWDPATKTCSSVACHLERQRQVDAGTKAPLRWGAPYYYLDGVTTCTGCHEK